MRNIFFLVCLTASCGDKFHEVKIEGFKFPRENFGELRSIAVTIGGDINKEFTQNTMKELARCSNFSKVKQVYAKINLAESRPNEYINSFERMIEQSKEARSFTGILSINVSRKNIQNRTEPSTSFKFYDNVPVVKAFG